MNKDHHAAALAALSEIQGVLHRHSLRKPSADTTPDMSKEPTEGTLADKNEDELMGEAGEVMNAGESGTGQTVRSELHAAESEENRVAASEPKEPEPMRLLSYGGRSSSMYDRGDEPSPSPMSEPMSQKRGRGRPRKY